MKKWQENRNYRKIRDDSGEVVAHIITVDGRDVAVTEDVFAAYAQMDRRERYLSEDLPTGKVLSLEQMAEDGVLPDYVGAETAPSAEPAAGGAYLLGGPGQAAHHRAVLRPPLHQRIRPANRRDPAGRHQAQGPDPEGPEKIF